MPFAKLFHVEGAGQVLAKLGTDDECKPELRWFAEPPGLGVCEFALVFEDSDDGWDKAEAALEKIGIEDARKAAKALWDAVGAQFETTSQKPKDTQ